jgi:hypothetical protein
MDVLGRNMRSRKEKHAHCNLILIKKPFIYKEKSGLISTERKLYDYVTLEILRNWAAKHLDA